MYRRYIKRIIHSFKRGSLEVCRQWGGETYSHKVTMLNVSFHSYLKTLAIHGFFLTALKAGACHLQFLPSAIVCIYYTSKLHVLMLGRDLSAVMMLLIPMVALPSVYWVMRGKQMALLRRGCHLQDCHKHIRMQGSALSSRGHLLVDMTESKTTGPWLAKLIR